MITNIFCCFLVCFVIASNSFGLQVSAKQIGNCLEFTFVNDEKNPICISDVEKVGTSINIVYDGGRGGVLFQPKNRSPYWKHLVVLMPKDEESGPQLWSCKFVIQSEKLQGKRLKDGVNLMIWKSVMNDAGKDTNVSLGDFKHIEVKASFDK